MGVYDIPVILKITRSVAHGVTVFAKHKRLAKTCVMCRIAVILTPLLRRIHFADRVKWGWVQLHKFGHIGVAGRTLVVGETRVIALLGRNESLFHVSAVSCFVAH